MNTEKFDLIVIGAGLGGLSAAGYMAKAGKKVLVLEHHTVPGGYAHEFRRGKYRFEVALHAIDGVAPGGWTYEILTELEVLEQVHFHRMDPFYSVRFGEQEFKASADIIAYEKALVQHFPAEAQGIRNLIDAMISMYWQTRRFITDGELDRRPPAELMPSQFPLMLASMSQNWGEFMGKYISDPQLQGVFSTLWGYYGLPPSQLNAATFILPWVSYHLFGAFYPTGGSMAMSRALEKTIKKYGGEIRYRQTVNAIEIKDGEAVAVTTEKGLRVEADLIISNANAPDTMLKFVDRKHLPADYTKQVESALEKSATSSVVVYLGLDRDLMAEEWPHHELFVSSGFDIEAEHKSVLEGRFEDMGIIISHYDQADPGCSPEGGSVLTITALAPWDYANQWGTGGNLENYQKNPNYLELKRAAGDALIDQVEKLIPGLRKSIKYVEVATPITNYRYSRNPGGSIYGSEQTVENMFINRLNNTTPIPNLFLAGAWVMGGGMSAAMLSGQNVSRKAMAYLDGGVVNDLFSPDMSALIDDDLDATTTPEPKLISIPITPPSPASVPAVTITSAVSARDISIHATGLPTILLFHAQDTASVANNLNAAVREQYPLASKLLIASVVDLSSVPKLFRKFATSAMRKSYAQAAKLLTPPMQAEDYIIILPDWDGGVTKACNFENTDKVAGMLVLNQQGQIIGRHQGDDLLAATMRLLADVMAD